MVLARLVIRYYQVFLRLLITVLKQLIDNQLGHKEFSGTPIISDISVIIGCRLRKVPAATNAGRRRPRYHRPHLHHPHCCPRLHRPRCRQRRRPRYRRPHLHLPHRRSRCLHRPRCRKRRRPRYRCSLTFNTLTAAHASIARAAVVNAAAPAAAVISSIILTAAHASTARAAANAVALATAAPTSTTLTAAHGSA